MLRLIVCVMPSVRTFVRLWAGFAAVIVAYAAIDRALNPWLTTEHSFSMEPDLTKLPDLVHWGGRLWHLNLPLLSLNAVLVGGLLSLAALSVRRVLHSGPTPKREETERISIFVTEPRPSSPPSR